MSCNDAGIFLCPKAALFGRIDGFGGRGCINMLRNRAVVLDHFCAKLQLFNRYTILFAQKLCSAIIAAGTKICSTIIFMPFYGLKKPAFNFE